ncbi:PDCD5-related protein [Dipodascopsis tothii]|uniref:PDCD5-related protein n=1 Tax=Dipodascopsis tothii TaxID=44089 RepID=UPI0034CE8387
MDDAELAAIRQARMAELQKQRGGGDAPKPAASGAAPDAARAEDDARAGMLAQILTPAARERLARIRIVKAQKAQGVEDLLLRMARSGQIRQRIDEDELIGLLDQISREETKANETRIVYQTRRYDAFDDDDLEDL